MQNVTSGQLNATSGRPRCVSWDFDLEGVCYSVLVIHTVVTIITFHQTTVDREILPLKIVCDFHGVKFSQFHLICKFVSVAGYNMDKCLVFRLLNMAEEPGIAGCRC